MKRLLLLSITLILAYTSFSQTSTVKADTTQLRKNISGKSIGLPDTWLLQAAIDITNGDACDSILQKKNSDIHLLNAQLFWKDSTIYELNKVHLDDSAIINANVAKTFIADSTSKRLVVDNKTLQNRYTSLKWNDRGKMGIGCVIIAALVYGIFLKK